jgi:putative transposase
VVDTQGWLVEVVVHQADIADRDGAKLVFQRVADDQPNPRLAKIWADSAYNGDLDDWLKEQSWGWDLERVKRPADAVGFVLLPRRWVVERTFSWFGHCRRLSKDYEYLTRSSETMIHLAMCRLMLKRLTRLRCLASFQTASEVRCVLPQTIYPQEVSCYARRLCRIC